MTDEEYLSALTDLRTRRAETIRIVLSQMEWLWWSRTPLMGMNASRMMQIQDIANSLLNEQCAPDVSTSSAEKTRGGNGSASPLSEPQVTTPSPATPLPIRLTTTAGTST